MRKPVFQIRTEMDLNDNISCYELYGKGRGIGDGISWTWIGTFPRRIYCYMMIKVITLKLKEKKNG